MTTIQTTAKTYLLKIRNNYVHHIDAHSNLPLYSTKPEAIRVSLETAATMQRNLEGHGYRVWIEVAS